MCDHRLVNLESDGGDVVLGEKGTQLSAEARASDRKTSGSNSQSIMY